MEDDIYKCVEREKERERNRREPFCLSGCAAEEDKKRCRLLLLGKWFVDCTLTLQLTPTF